MSKDILTQYSDLQEEIKEVRRRIVVLENQIAEYEKSGYTEIDKVKGGEGGWQGFKIEGFPHEKYSKKKTLLYSRKAILETLEYDLLEMTNDVEEYIANVKDSEMRRILAMRFIDNMSLDQIGQRLNYDHSNVSRKISKHIQADVAHNAQT